MIPFPPAAHAAQAAPTAVAEMDLLGRDRAADDRADGDPAASDPAAIDCRDLVRIYTAEGIEVQALQGLDLRVAAGELIAVIGESGSGKSTLLTILAGLDRPTAGTALVGGFDLMRMSRAQRVRYQRHVVGFVWQRASRNLLPYLTAAENIAMVLSLAGSPGRAATQRRIDDLLELLGVADCAGRRPAELSGGQQQRVAIGVALANRPTVLLADEPTGELDETSTEQVLSALRSVNEETGVTTLIVTHDLAVAQHVRRTIRIQDGRIVTETMRRSEPGPDGTQLRRVEDFAVVDRLGRMVIPESSMTRLDISRRVRLAEHPDRLEVRPASAAAPAAQTPHSAAQLAAQAAQAAQAAPPADPPGQQESTTTAAPNTPRHAAPTEEVQP